MTFIKRLKLYVNRKNKPTETISQQQWNQSIYDFLYLTYETLIAYYAK